MENNSSRDIKISAGPVSTIIYMIYFTLLFGARAIGLYDGQAVYNTVLILGMVLFVLKIATTKHSVIEYLVIALFLFLGCVVYYSSGEKGLLIYFTMMLGMKAVDKAKVMKLGFVILSISFSVLYLLSVTGCIENINYMNKRGGYGFLMRHSLGYPYPNTTHTTFLVLLILFFYLAKEKPLKDQIRYSVVAMILNGLLYIYTVSLTGILSVTVYLAVNIYFHARKNRSKFENVLIFLVFPVSILFSILGPILLKGEAFEFMDKLLHKRYLYAHYFLENEHLSPFGSYFAEAPTSWYMLDNSFLYLFLQLGVITFVTVCLVYIQWIIHTIKYNEIAEMAVMITFCFIGMSDPFLFNLSYKNLTFIFIGAWLFKHLEDATAKLPESLKGEVVVLPTCKVKMVLTSTITRLGTAVLTAIKKEFNSHLVTYLVLFVIIASCGAFTYKTVTPEPKTLYVDTATVDPYFSHKSTEMTPEDVNAALANGDLVESYSEDDPVMYIFTGSAPHLEYLRNILSCGLVSGSLLVLAVVSGRAILVDQKDKK